MPHGAARDPSLKTNDSTAPTIAFVLLLYDLRRDKSICWGQGTGFCPTTAGGYSSATFLQIFRRGTQVLHRSLYAMTCGQPYGSPSVLDAAASRCSDDLEPPFGGRPATLIA